MELGTETASYTPENLLAGNFPVEVMPFTVASGAGVIAKHTVLGRVTATGKLKPYDDAATDGSEVAEVILAEDIDATSEDVPVQTYVTGSFNKAALVGIDDVAIIQLRKVGIFVKVIL